MDEASPSDDAAVVGATVSETAAGAARARVSPFADSAEIAKVMADVFPAMATEPPPAAGAPAPEKSAPEPDSPLRTLAVRIPVESPLLPFDIEDQRAADQYRMAGRKLLHDPRHPRLVVVSSVGAGDGKTVSAINLAGAMALETDRDILLVDADLRQSQVSPLLGIPNAPGLAGILGGWCRFEDAIVRLEQLPNLCVLAGGKPTPNPVELLHSSRWDLLCASLRKQFQYVIFDAPAMSAAANYELIQSQCDGVLLVVRPGHTDRKLCLRAIERIPKEQLLGVLMNCVSEWFLWKAPESGD
jgi:capsular exopolysaccharide synthesis family protein